MKAIGVKRDTAAHDGTDDEVRVPDRFPASLDGSDVVTLTCPLTPETQNWSMRRHCPRRKPGAYLISVARGRCVDKPTLVDALVDGLFRQSSCDVSGA